MASIRFFSLCFLYVSSVLGEYDVVSQRKNKFLNLFTIVRFPNNPCTGDVSGKKLNGICYSPSECSQFGGSNAGSCASGFGVCCIVTKGCDSETTVNSTYWEASLKDIGSCTFTVKDLPEDVCQIRLEFEEFTTSPPNNEGDCIDDMFTADEMSTGSSNEICGENTGQHVILHTGRGSADVKMSVQSTTANENRKWRIQVIFTPCDSSFLAPLGCTQYHIGSSGQLKSFNFPSDTVADATHLNNQNYGICFRGEQSRSRVQLTACSETSFAISGDGTPPTGTTPAKKAGVGIGTTGGNACGDNTAIRDSLFIPCARAAGDLDNCGTSVFCGNRLNPKGGNVDNTPVTTNLQTVLRFITDETEVATTGGTADQQNRGFCLNFVQI